MEIDRPASNVVTGGAQPAPSSKSDSIVEVPKGAASLKEKPQSFRDTEGMQQTDLDSMMGDQAQTKIPKKGGKPSKEVDLDDEDDDIDDDDDDLDEEAEETEGEDADDGDEEEDEEDLEEEDEESDDEEGDDEEHEASEEDDAKVHKVKVNGESRKYSLNDLKNIASSGLHRANIFEQQKTKIAADEVRVGQEKAKLAVTLQKIEPIYQAIKEKKLDDAFLSLAKEAGFNKLAIQRHLIDKFEPVICARLGLSQDFIAQQKRQNEARVKQMDLEEENKFLKEERAPKAADPETERLQQVEQQVREAALEHGFSKQDLIFASQWFEEQGIQNYEAPQITELLLNRRAVRRAIEVVAHKRPSLAKDEKFVQRTIAKLKANPAWMEGPNLGKWVEKKARRLSADSSKDQEQTLTRELSRKALKNKSKASFNKPKSGQKRAMKFSDFGDGGALP